MLQRVPRHRSAVLFAACCAWIGAVSAHDAVLVIVHRQWISQLEQNPLGRWLIQLHGGDVWLFVMVKLAGTAMVCTVLVEIHRHRADIARAVAMGLACFQTLLLLYLHVR